MAHNMVALIPRRKSNRIFWNFETVIDLKLMYFEISKLRQFTKLKLTCGTFRKQPYLFVLETYSNQLHVSHSFSNYSGSYWTVFVFLSHFPLFFCHLSSPPLYFLNLLKRSFVLCAGFFWDLLGSSSCRGPCYLSPQDSQTESSQNSTYRNGFSIIVGFTLSSQPCRTI